MPISTSSNKAIGITLGDPAGIGPEVIARALVEPTIHRLSQFVLIGDSTVLNRYLQKIPPHCRMIDLKNISPAKWCCGQPSRHSAQASLDYLQCAIELLKAKHIDALVTAPVCKEAIGSLGVRFSGHTEYLAESFGVKKVGMMFVTTTLKTVIATRHIPLKQVSRQITPELILETILLTQKALKRYFKIRHPQIAVCGLNPHAGEKGTMGTEEVTTIIPAIKKAQRRDIRVSGPYSADTIFYSQNSKNFNAIIALYHDQGLIALKTLAFRDLVNLTIGLPFVRTSPAHGTAFDIAGKNRADPASMKAAITLACQLAHEKEYRPSKADSTS